MKERHSFSSLLPPVASESFSSCIGSSDSSSSSSSGCDDGCRRVSFSTIEIHEHAMIMGNNPWTSHGCPLEIDWEEVGNYSLNLEDYEESRPPRRIRDELAMPGDLREAV
jgi:hypothetical protein